MSKVIVIYSTLAADMAYTNYANGGAELPNAEQVVHVKGGAGVANDRLVTPMGVATVLTDEGGTTAAEKLAALKANKVFQLHEKNGYVIVSEEKQDPEKMAANMNTNDPSKPLNDQQLTKDDADLTVTGNTTKKK
jgi:hypothetical protein